MPDFSTGPNLDKNLSKLEKSLDYYSLKNKRIILNILVFSKPCIQQKDDDNNSFYSILEYKKWCIKLRIIICKTNFTKQKKIE